MGISVLSSLHEDKLDVFYKHGNTIKTREQKNTSHVLHLESFMIT